MGPENEGKPSSTSSRTVDVRHGALEEIENLLEKARVQIDDIWASDIVPRANVVSSEDSTESEDAKLEAVRNLNTKQENMKLTMEVALLKLRSIMLPRQRRSEEDVNNSNLKRSRSNGPLDVPRLPGMAAVKLDVEDLPTVNELQSHGSSFDIMSPAAVPLKFIRTNDNSKAAFQKPIIFSSDAAASGDLVSNGDAAGLDGPTASEGLTPKKRPSRSRRERNRSRDKVAALPEPVMQTLQPGDQNKIPEDGYLWRKYGNKNIKTASYKRGYYKCRHFKEVRCPATKIVQQTNNDPSTFSVRYTGEHTCRQLGNQSGFASCGPLLGEQESNGSLGDQVNEAINMTDSKIPDAEKDMEKDDILESMDWPAGENSSDSADDAMFGSADVGEEAVESNRIILEPTTTLEPRTILEPASPLLDFVDMTTMPTLPMNTLASSEIVDASAAWNEAKVKFQPIETCPGDEKDNSQCDVGGLNDNDQLLKFINGSLWDDQPSDISFWYPDMGIGMEPFSYSHADLFSGSA